ncbi:tigger transposable element-derived protein 1-like [Palaemon carinicauda]|uniref:tigger transposable element-derived protein 1-like n=1 Tax=Palaemon carinicauda TaxID=392227 RepID=UPI0035B590DF
MDQGVIASFKAYYLRKTIAMALQATETKKDSTLKDFWKSYNILDAVKNIADSWEEVKMTKMNGVWRKLCPQFVNDFVGFEDTVDHVVKNIVALSKEIDLDMDVDDVTELLESPGEELSAEDLIQLEKQIIEEEETPTPDPKTFTRQGLSKGFAEIQQALATFEAQDHNMDRFTRVSRGMMGLLQCYKEILDEKMILSVHSNLERYFKKVERPAPSTSGASTTPDLPATKSLPSTSAASIATEPLLSTSAACIATEPPPSTSAASIASPASPSPSVGSASPPDSPAPASPPPSVSSASPPDSPAPASPASSVSLPENPDSPAPVSPASSAAFSPQ